MSNKVIYIIDEFEFGGQIYERCILDKPSGAQLVRLKKNRPIKGGTPDTIASAPRWPGATSLSVRRKTIIS